MSGTILEDASMLEYHILTCLSEQWEPFTNIHTIFTWLKDNQVLYQCESKKRTNRALHNLVQWKIVTHKIENKVPMYALPSTKTKKSEPTSPACSPPPKGQSSYLPMGYSDEALKPHNFQISHAVEGCTKHILNDLKSILTNGIGRNMHVSHVEFNIDVPALLRKKLRGLRPGIVHMALDRAVRCMEELGWKCHMTKQIEWKSAHVTVPPDAQLILTC